MTHDGVGVSTWELVPALLAFGLGMGFVFGSLFDVILASVEEHEVGSASGTLNAVQQLGNSIGVAVLATIFFSLLDHGHTSPTALARTVLSSAAVFVVAFGLFFLLPKDARMEEFWPRPRPAPAPRGCRHRGREGQQPPPDGPRR